jgi:hypothetical protein
LAVIAVGAKVITDNETVGALMPFDWVELVCRFGMWYVVVWNFDQLEER